MRAFTTGFSLAGGAALALVAAACHSGGPAVPLDAGSQPGAVYVIDSTGSMFSFDARGAPLGHVKVASPIGDLNGGGIALGSGDLYITIDEKTNAVRAYSLALTPVTLGAGAFAGLDVPRGIAFDTHDGDFYVGNGGPARRDRHLRRPCGRRPWSRPPKVATAPTRATRRTLGMRGIRGTEGTAARARQGPPRPSISTSGGSNCGTCANSSMVVTGLNPATNFTISISDVTLSNNYANGFSFLGARVGPALGSGTLTVTDWGTGDDPFNIDFNSAGLLANATLSIGTKTQGTVHLVNSYGSIGSGQVDVSQTWPALPPRLSYVIGRDADVEGQLLLLITPGASTDTTLKIAAPNAFSIGNGFWFAVDGLTGATGHAALVAEGTSVPPATPNLVFEGLGASPTPGSWQGFYFNEVSSPYTELLSRLDNVVIDSAGGLFTNAYLYSAAIQLYDGNAEFCVPGPTLKEITFKNLLAGASGILAADVGKSTVGNLRTKDGNTGGSVTNLPPPTTAPHWQCQ